MANTSFPKAFANMDGKIIPLQEAKVSALDRGFLFGDAVYEVLWVHKGKQWLKEGHYNRLDRSLKLVRIHGVDLNALDQKVQQTIEFGKFQDAIVYIQITRGSAPRAHAFSKMQRESQKLSIYAVCSSPWARISTALGPKSWWSRAWSASTGQPMP